MRRFTFILLTFALFYHSGHIHGQKVIRGNHPAGICYAGSNINRIFVPPPKEFYLKDRGKGATIKVYYSGFTSAPKAAFQYAVSILSSLLPENTSFTVKAFWGPMSDNGVLGSTSITSYQGGTFIDALDPDAYYPVALAEKISGEKLNSDEEGDLIMSLNSNITWYTGIDGNTFSGSYDLVTVVLHELIHGIGFVDSFNSSNGLGSYGANSIPLIYDTFIEDINGYLLTDTTKYVNNSSGLNTKLLGSHLYFKGPLLDALTNGSRARIYVPVNWDPGSSIAHLNESTFNNTSAALLTPFLAMEEAIHSPGDTILSILGDLGWINTKIAHIPLADTEANLSEVKFKASITSDTSFNRDFTGVVYSFNNFTTSDTLFLVPPQSGDTFMVNLAIPSYDTQLSYYLFAVDRFKRNYRLPSPGESSPFRVFIGTDTVKPVIDHIPAELLFEKATTIRLTANAYDNIGIDTVYIEYKKNNGVCHYTGLRNDSLDIYSGNIDIKSLSLTKDDSVQYRIYAIDSSSSSNTSYLPDSAYYVIRLEPTFDVMEGYSTNFTSASSEFINSGFSITMPEQFTSPALHTKHPYESPGKDNESLEYTSVLRYPVKADESGIIVSFRQIVLVEPGEEGSVYTSSDFYDYVIVEATKDFGATWFPLRNGYDSRISSLFLDAYNSSMSGGNSTFVGKQELYQNLTIDIRTFEKFKKGDTLILRFRLYSDPYAYGWGWAIDDLSVKSVAAGIENTIAETGLTVYPNPGNGLLWIDMKETNWKEISYKIISISGSLIRSGIIPDGQNGLIDLTDQPPGIYVVVLRTGNTIHTARYSKLR